MYTLPYSDCSYEGFRYFVLGLGLKRTLEPRLIFDTRSFLLMNLLNLVSGEMDLLSIGLANGLNDDFYGGECGCCVDSEGY